MDCSYLAIYRLDENSPLQGTMLTCIYLERLFKVADPPTVTVGF